MGFLGKKQWKDIISVFLCSNLTPGQYSIGIRKTPNCVDWVGWWDIYCMIPSVSQCVSIHTMDAVYTYGYMYIKI